MRGLVLVAAVLTVLTGCAVQGDSDTPRDETVTQAATDLPATDAPATVPPTTDPTDTHVAPDPDGTYTRSCDYLLGDFSESKSGYRFVADARIRNTGNIGTVTRVRAIWYLAGGDKVTEHKKVRTKPRQAKRVGFVRVATDDEIDRHQSLGYSSKTCTVKARIVDTFGKATK